MLQRPIYCLQNIFSVSRMLFACKHTINYTKLPKINECDLNEQFVRGGGPGGSAVNKNANCVVLIHLPTGKLHAYFFFRKDTNCCAMNQYFKMLLRPNFGLQSAFPLFHKLVVFKHTVDFSKVPKINENDLLEKFVRGRGPGGQAVNKNANCVVLTHLPTGTVVKCHISRSQDENRKLAREMLVKKLDEMLNGEDSVVAQKKRNEEKKFKRTEYKKKKMAILKSEWKKREGLE